MEENTSDLKHSNLPGASYNSAVSRNPDHRAGKLSATGGESCSGTMEQRSLDQEIVGEDAIERN